MSNCKLVQCVLHNKKKEGGREGDGITLKAKEQEEMEMEEEKKSYNCTV